jgi:hypothetical protein
MTMTMVGLKPRPVHPSLSLLCSRPSHPPSWSGSVFKFEGERDHTLLLPDCIEEGEPQWLSRICLEPPRPKRPKQKKKPYNHKEKQPRLILIGGGTGRGFGPPPP